MADEARQREGEFRDLSGRLLQLQDEERRRLASDLHDSMGQHLAALTMQLDLILSATVALDATSRQMLEEGRALADECSREVRTLAHLLHPPMLDLLGLVSAVRWYVEGFTKRSGMHVSMNLDEVGRLPEPTETALYRVVQESLTNVHRHAASASTSIRLTRTADAVVLHLQDQGHGLRDRVTDDKAAPSPQTLGVGIQGMRERVRQLGGTCDIEFTNQGTTVRVAVPVGRGSR
jgi:signal transduction histidine kinase